MFCPNCGKPNADNSTFCGWCGTSLKEFSNMSASPEIVKQQNQKKTSNQQSNNTHATLPQKSAHETVNKSKTVSGKNVANNQSQKPLSAKNASSSNSDNTTNTQTEKKTPDEKKVNDEAVEESVKTKKSSKGLIFVVLALIACVAAGVWFYLNYNQEETSDPAAIPKAPYQSSLLEGLNACGSVYAISLGDNKFYFNRAGKCVEGETRLPDGCELSSGDANDGMVSVIVKNDHLFSIKFVTIRQPEVVISFNKYNELGLPIRAELLGGVENQTYEVKVKCSDFDSYGNWTRMTIDKPDSSEDYVLSFYPSEITRTIEYWTDDKPDLVAKPTDSELELLLKLANKLDRTAISKEFIDLREQAMEAPYNVWDGGFTSYDLNSELLFGGEETPDEIHLVSLKRHPSDDMSQFFAYVTLEAIYGNYKNTSSYLIYFILEDGRWKLNDVDNSPANEYYGEHSLSEEMKNFIQRANEDIISGQTEQDVREVFSFDSDRMERMLNQISDYRSKYNI